MAITACSLGKAAQEDATKISAMRGRISLLDGIIGEAREFIDNNQFITRNHQYIVLMLLLFFKIRLP